MDLRSFPISLQEFREVFPNDTVCAKYLEAMRWPKGFTCSKCLLTGEPYRFKTRSSIVLRCRACKYNTSLTADTVIQSSHVPLSMWFLGAYLVTTQQPGQPALEFKRQLGISRYETAYRIIHKLRTGMLYTERDYIGDQHPIEIDKCLVAAHSGGGSRAVRDKATILGAIEICTRKSIEHRSPNKKHKKAGELSVKTLTYTGRLRLRVIKAWDSESLISFALENITQGSKVRTDGREGCDELLRHGYAHEPLVPAGDPTKGETYVPMIRLVFSNLKAWMLDTHYGGIGQRNLQAYLNEYIYRFNHRFSPMTIFNSVLGLASRANPPTYAELHSGNWRHSIS